MARWPPADATHARGAEERCRLMAIPGFRHLGLKFLSVVLAALVWVLVSGEQTVERALRIPVEFTNLPADLELVSGPPTVVDVRVRGSSGALNRIQPGELVAVVDLKGARSGQRLFHVTGSDVRAPFGTSVVQVSPSNLDMTFEHSASKAVPVIPALEGEPADGYLVGKAVSEPATVQIIGPESAVARVNNATTEPVSVAGAKTNISESVMIGVSDPSVRLAAPVSALVNVSVAPAPVEWAIAGIKIDAGPAHGTVQISPSEVTVFVRGPRDTRSARAEDFKAWIDIEGLQPGLFKLPVQVTPPDRIGIFKLEPPVVQVRIR
jgi:YbbR domain-containing protein